MEFLETLGAELVEEGRIKRVDRYTNEYPILNMNLGLSLVLPTLRHGPDSDPDYGAFNYLSLHRLALCNVITSLEVYYQDIVMKISQILKISEINPANLKKFCKKYRIELEGLEPEVSLYEIFPNYLSFQNKDTIKNSMNLIGLDPIGKHNDEWGLTYGNNPQSTIKIRNECIHGGIHALFSDTMLIHLNIEFVKDRIKCAMVLSRHLEEQIEIIYPQITNENMLKGIKKDD